MLAYEEMFNNFFIKTEHLGLLRDYFVVVLYLLRIYALHT